MTIDNGNRERTLVLTPDQASLARVSDFFDVCVEEFDIPMKLGFKLKVIVDEVYSNIVYYSTASEAEVCFRDAGACIELCFRDNGIAFNPLEAKAADISAELEDRQIGGLGMLMVRNMAKELDYAYSGGKNVLTILLSKTMEKKKLSLEDF